MDKTSLKVPPWRRPQSSTANSNLNASATAFVPSGSTQGPRFTPYEPLRVSNGSAERTVVEEANSTVPKKNKKNGLATSNFGATNSQIHSRAHLKVDSWRSYRNDATTLQSTSLVVPSAVPQVAAKYNPTPRAWADQALPSIEVDNVASIRYVNPSKRSGARQSTPRRTTSPPVPKTTVQYRVNAEKEPVTLSKDQPRRLLVVLDLNGTLLYRTKSVSGAKVHMRPGVTPFMDYLFENHVVMVYTSTMPTTATAMVSQFLHPTQRSKLAALWARDKLDLTEDQFVNKVQVYKKLDKIWTDELIQQTAGPGNRWDQSNTILVDDSKLKALAQPHNLLQVPEYTKQFDPANAKAKGEHKKVYKEQQDIVKQLELKLEELKYQEDVSRLIRKWQSSEVAVPRLPGQENVVEESVDQKNVQDEEERRSSSCTSQLLTPDSMRDGQAVEKPMDMSISDDRDTSNIPTPRSTPTPSLPPSAYQSDNIPGLGGLEQSDMTEKQIVQTLQIEQTDRSGSVSSIDEAVFRELLEGSGK